MNQNLRYVRISSSQINKLDISLFMYQVVYLFLVTLYDILRVLLVQPGTLLTVFIVRFGDLGATKTRRKCFSVGLPV